MFRNKYKAHKHGFTLIELLVTIGVIVVVISIMIPALKHMRDRAIVVKSLSGHRNIASMVEGYGIDRGGRLPFPYIRREGTFANPIYIASESKNGGYVAASMAFQARIWASLIVRSNPSIAALVYQGRWEPIAGRDVPNGLIGGSFVATSTMFADPQFFGINLDEVHVGQLRPTRTSQIAFPSSKVMFEDLESWGRIPSSNDESRSATFGFADGSAQGMSQNEFTGDWVERATAWQIGPGHTTLNGLAGRDR